MAYTCGLCKKNGHSRRNCPDKNKEPIATTEPGAAIPVIDEPADERRIVVIRTSATEGVNLATEKALRRQKRKAWRLFYADELATGVRLAFAVDAVAVVICENDSTDKKELRPWVDRIKTVLPQAKIIAVYRPSSDEQIDEDLEIASFNHWINPDGDRFELTLAKAIKDWEPEDKIERNWKSWEVPNRQRITN